MLLPTTLASYSFGENHFNLLTDPTATGNTKGVTFFARTGTNTNNYHYAKIVVLKNAPGGGYLHDNTPTGNTYVEVLVSYQTAAGVPYAKYFAK